LISHVITPSPTSPANLITEAHHNHYPGNRLFLVYFLQLWISYGTCALKGAPYLCTLAVAVILSVHILTKHYHWEHK